MKDIIGILFIIIGPTLAAVLLPDPDVELKDRIKIGILIDVAMCFFLFGAYLLIS